MRKNAFRFFATRSAARLLLFSYDSSAEHVEHVLPGSQQVFALPSLASLSDAFNLHLTQ